MDPVARPSPPGDRVGRPVAGRHRASGRGGPAARPRPDRPAPLRRGADDPAGGRGSGGSRDRALDVRVVRGAPGRGGPGRDRRVHDRAGSRDGAARAAGQARRRPRRAALRRARRARPRSSSSAGSTTTRRSRSRPGIHATFVDAGHILGSAIIRLRVADHDGGPELRIVFSGDLGRTGTPILRDPTIVTDADYVLDRVDLRRARARAGARRPGSSPRPCGWSPTTTASCSSRRSRSGGPRRSSGSSTGSSAAGKIPLLPLYLDSPMASKASDIYRAHPDYYDEETRDLLRHERVAARLPEPDRHQRRPAVAGDRPGASGRT